MSIFKQSFPKWIKEQIQLRQDLQATGISGGYKSNQALVWNNSRQCTVRATSLVNYKQNVNLSISDGNNIEEFQKLKGSELAKRFILQGGILNNGQTRSAEFGKPGSAYGDPLLGANGGFDGFGQVPMPGITNLDIATKSAYGSLRQAKLSFVVHNLRQLEIMELLYLRPGYPILVEWQWTPFISNDGNIDTLEYRVSDDIVFPKGDGKVFQEKVYNSVIDLKKRTGGNYDGFLGFVTNFGFQAREDGGFDCYSEIVSMGEVLDSLKIPSSRSAFRKIYPGKDIKFSLSREDQDEPEEIKNPDALRGVLIALAKLTGTVDTAGGEEEWTLQWFETDDSPLLVEAIIEHILRKFPPVAVKDANGNDKYTKEEKFEKLGQYFLRKNKITKAGDFDAPLNTGYIRWDLLAFLINEFVISDPTRDGDTDENNENPPTKIVQHFYRNDPNNQDSKIPELLKYVKFKGANPEESIDLSCDPGICILPHSFFDTRLQHTIDPDQGTLGYFAEAVGDMFEWGWNRLKRNVVDAFTTDSSEIGGNEIGGGSEVELKNAKEELQRFIGGIWLNTDMLLGAYDASIKGNKNADLGDFLKSVWEDKVNEACPLHNFVFSINSEYPNECYIIDLPVDGDDMAEIAKNIFEIEVQSNKSVVREYDLQATVPDALKSTIAVHAQSPETTEDLDDLTFQAFNRAIENRLYIKNDIDDGTATEDPPEDTRTEEEKEEDARLGLDSTTMEGKIKKKYLLALEEFNKQSALYFEIINSDENDSVSDSDDKVNDLKSTLKEVQTSAMQMKELEHKSVNTSAVIPLEFTMTLDGISNIIIGCLFKIREDRLPRAYRPNNNESPGGANVAFIVFKEEQTITAGQDWTTKIAGKMILLPNDENIKKSTSVGNGGNQQGNSDGTGRGAGTGNPANEIIPEASGTPMDRIDTSLLPIPPTEIISDSPQAQLITPTIDNIEEAVVLPNPSPEETATGVSQEVKDNVFQQFVELDRRYFTTKYTLSTLIEAAWATGTNAYSNQINELTMDLTPIVNEWERFRPQVEEAFGTNWNNYNSSFQTRLREEESNTVIPIDINGQIYKPFVIGSGASNLQPNTVDTYLNSIFTVGGAEIE